MMDVRGKKVLIVGLARSGRAAARWFRLRGAVVTVTDSRPPCEFAPDIPELLAQKIGVELGTHREETFRLAIAGARPITVGSSALRTA